MLISTLSLIVTKRTTTGSQLSHVIFVLFTQYVPLSDSLPTPRDRFPNMGVLTSIRHQIICLSIPSFSPSTTHWYYQQGIIDRLHKAWLCLRRDENGGHVGAQQASNLVEHSYFCYNHTLFALHTFCFHHNQIVS